QTNITATSITTHLFTETAKTIRTVTIGDDVMFIAKDVAAALGYKNLSDAVSKHCKRVSRFATPSEGGTQEMNVIPESDVYRLIMRSKLPAAEAFEDWVVEEVLPSIRKAGGYVDGLSVSDGVSMEAQRILFDHLKAQAIPVLRELDTLNRYGN